MHKYITFCVLCFLGSAVHEHMYPHVCEQMHVGTSILEVACVAVQLTVGLLCPADLVLVLQVHLACLAFTWLLVAGHLNAGPHNCMATVLPVEMLYISQAQVALLFGELLFFPIQLCFVNITQRPFSTNLRR